MKRSYNFAERKNFLDFVDAAREDPVLSNHRLSQLLLLVAGTKPVPTNETFHRWQREALSQTQYQARLHRRGRRPSLTDEQKQLLLGYACDRRRSLIAVSLQHLRDFASTHLHTDLPNCTISLYMIAGGFSSQRSLKRNTRMTTQQVVDDSIAFLEVVRGYQYSSDRIIMMDETGLWSNVVQPRTYHYRGGYVSHTFLDSSVFLFLIEIVSFSYFLPLACSCHFILCGCSLRSGNAVVSTEGDRFRDTAALTVRADGKDIPPFLIKGQVGSASYASGRRPKRGEKAVGGMNTALMMKYADHLVGYVEEPSLLILDRASSHTARLTKEYIESFLTQDGLQLLHVEYIPAKAAFLVSALDNGVNAAFKQHFYTYDRSTFELKKSAVKLAWDKVTNDSILNICKRCGLDEQTSLRTIRASFEKNVRAPIPEKLKGALELYDMWKSGNIAIDGADLQRGVVYSSPHQLDDGTMDGYKWIEWGD